MAKITKPNTCPLGLYRLKDLPRGEYVKRVDLCTQCNATGQYGFNTCGQCDGKGYTKAQDRVYIRGEYCRSDLVAGKYELSAFDGSRVIYQRGNVLVLAGFTF